MKITFLGQGYEPESVNGVGNHLILNLAANNFHSFFGVSAFASKAGVVGLKEYIITAKQYFKSLSLIVGIDQEGTSKEALLEINSLDINSYIFYQNESPIFHPKLYLFEGEKETKLIIGSSNLTANGLFRNIESSLLVEFSSDDKNGQNLIADLKTYYSGLFKFNDPNLFRINKEIIESFISKGIVPNESVRLKKYGKKGSDAEATSGKINIPKRQTAKVPRAFRSEQKSEAVSETNGEPEMESEATVFSSALSSIVTDSTEPILIWESGPLSERDLNIPSGSNTNKTGSMLLKKGLWEGIDQRHYFRDEVFSTLIWRPNTRRGSEYLEKATAQIRLIINGHDHGVFPLVITHNPRTDTESYEQNNSMTSISWGAVKELIANRDLIGSSARLYKDRTANDTYTLSIA